MGICRVIIGSIVAVAIILFGVWTNTMHLRKDKPNAEEQIKELNAVEAYWARSSDDAIKPGDLVIHKIYAELEPTMYPYVVLEILDNGKILVRRKIAGSWFDTEKMYTCEFVRWHPANEEVDAEVKATYKSGAFPTVQEACVRK